MAKKKIQGKKHKFKYSEPSGAVLAAPVNGSQQVESSPTTRVSGQPARPAVAVVGRDFSYVSADLKRVVVLATSLVAFELVLWYLFGHTALGNNVYRLIKV